MLKDSRQTPLDQIPLDQIPLDQAVAVARRIMRDRGSDATTVDVARFGSSI